MRWGTPIAALLAGLVLRAPAARAEEPTPDRRAAVERALLEGRVADLPALGEDARTIALSGWRDAIGIPRFRVLHVEFASLVAPYPIVRALLEDRDRRLEGGPWSAEHSPLAKLPDPERRIRWFLSQLASIHEPVRDEDSPDPVLAAEGRAKVERARDLMQRSGVLGGAAIAALVLLTLLAAWLTRQRAKTP